MSSTGTEQALAAITDEAEFERIATAVLRIAEPICRGLTHPGVTADGKTRKAPLDGIGFVAGADPPHLVAAQHTTTQASGLRSKWLNDPALVTPRRGRSKPAAPPGDLLKTAEIVADERRRTPPLRATLFLTTNTEPDEALVRDVVAAGRQREIDVQVRSRSQLAQVLDIDADGQWVRAQHLGLPAERLSHDLLRELCRRSLAASAPPDDPLGWAPRALDRTLGRLQRPVTLLAAASGLGKSVACFRWVKQHVDAGGFGVVLPHEILSASLTIDQALQVLLQRLHLALGRDERPLALCDRTRPMLVVVEDINASGEAERLIEKLATWSSAQRNEATPGAWRLICPVWPQVIGRLGETVRKAVEPLVLTPPPFTPVEGLAAVTARAALRQQPMGQGAAKRLAEVLGNDPLLIALHEGDDTADASRVIEQYVERSVQRLEEASGHDATAVFEALRALGREMLVRRQLEPRWTEVRGWGLSTSEVASLHALALRHEVLRLEGDPRDPTLRFRHDRVRDWILIDAATHLFSAGALAAEVLGEPMFAEILGGSLARIEPVSPLLVALNAANPLAVFHGLRLCRQGDPRRGAIAAALHEWLADPSNRDQNHGHLRWAAELVTGEIVGPEVTSLAKAFPRPWIGAWSGLLRNGDLAGAMYLFAKEPLGTRWAGRDELIDDVKLRYGQGLIHTIVRLLGDRALSLDHRVGLVKFAGFVGDPRLGAPLLAAFHSDGAAAKCLEVYLWALARCCEPATAAALLGPVCDAWAGLSDVEPEAGRGSPRNSLAADGARMEFRCYVPVGALAYLIDRAARPDLRWPITYMLHEIDHPLVLTFFVEGLARQDDETGRNGWDFHPANNHWWRMRDAGVAMSLVSRSTMQGLWTDRTVRPSRRRAAFLFWASVEDDDDLPLLRQFEGDADLEDRVLRARAYRGDRTAVPLVVAKLRDTGVSWTWWHAASSMWDAAFLEPIVEALDVTQDDAFNRDRDLDWHLSEMLEHLTPAEAEAVLAPRWERLRRRPRFFQKALYFATPRLLELAAETVAQIDDPTPLFDHIASSYGLNFKGRPGIQRVAQIEALALYLGYLKDAELRSLAEICNRHGWFDLRRRLLDARLDDRWSAWRPQDTAKTCDSLVEHQHVFGIDHEIDAALQTGVTWPDLLDHLEAWWRGRGDLQALALFAHAIEHQGTREDLTKLEVLEGVDPQAAAAIIENATFTVKRRSAR